MEKKVITFADALDSLNRIDLMMDDFLLNLEGWNDVKDKGSLLFFLIEDYERNINGDESIGVYGLEDVVRFIVNECNRPLANKLFSIGVKNTKADELIKSFQEFWNPSFQFLGTLSELYFKIDSVNNEILFAKEGVGIQDTNQSEIVPETGNNNKLINGQKETPNEVTLTKDEIINSVADINPYNPLNPDEPINYQEYYKRLCDGGVIDSQYGLDLFTYCVERADISKIIAKPEKKIDRKKSFARLFMNDVASVFSAAAAYRKAAAKAFNLGDNTHIGSVGGNVKTDYQVLMKGLFKTNWQKKK